MLRMQYPVHRAISCRLLEGAHVGGILVPCMHRVRIACTLHVSSTMRALLHKVVYSGLSSNISTSYIATCRLCNVLPQCHGEGTNTQYPPDIGYSRISRYLRVPNQHRERAYEWRRICTSGYWWFYRPISTPRKRLRARARVYIGLPR